MAQYYSKIYVINQLQKHSLNTCLQSLGVANLKMLSYANAYNTLKVFESTGHTRAEAVKKTATKCRVSRRTMYNIIRDMESTTEIPAAVVKLLSTN